MTVLAVDIGNSGVHIGAFRGRKLAWRTGAPLEVEDPVGTLEGLLCARGISLSDVRGAVVGSVVRGTTKVWTAALRGLSGVEPLVARGRSDWGIEVSYDDPDSVGVDRLSAASEAYRSVGGPVVVVDVGTAITVDVVSGDGAFLGGVIAAGPKLMSLALHEHTSLLPLVEPKHGVGLLGCSTVDCIRSGLLYGTASLVDGLVKRARGEVGDATVVATGGGLDFVLPALEERVDVVDPDLVLKGLYRLFRRERGL